MNRDQAASILLNAVREREEARRTITQAERDLEGLTDVIRGILKMYPDMETGDEFEWGDAGPDGEVPRGADAVRMVLEAKPGGWFTVGDMLAELRERDWLPRSDNPANAIRAALERAYNQSDGSIDKGRMQDNRVAYSYKANEYQYEEEPF